MNGECVESSRCSAGSVKELWPCPPPSSSGRCRPATQLLNWGGVNASDILLPYPSRPAVVSQKLSVRERHRLCRAHLVSHTLQRCSIGILLPDRLSRETRWGCRGSECTNSTVILETHVPLSQPHPDGSKTRCCFHPSSCFLSGLHLLREGMLHPLKHCSSKKNTFFF